MVSYTFYNRQVFVNLAATQLFWIAVEEVSVLFSMPAILEYGHVSNIQQLLTGKCNGNASQQNDSTLNF